MHAYLLIGEQGNELKTYAEKLNRKLKSRLVEFEIKKIADVRSLSEFTKLSLNEPTSIYIKNVEKATNEALNAFLKNLEEPQQGLQYILTAYSPYALPDTIVSRCEVVRLKKKDSLNISDTAYDFFTKKLTEKILIIDGIKKREEAVEFIKTIIYSGHTLLLENNDKNRVAQILKVAQDTYLALDANGNVNLQLSVFAFKSHLLWND